MITQEGKGDAPIVGVFTFNNIGDILEHERKFLFEPEDDRAGGGWAAMKEMKKVDRCRLVQKSASEGEGIVRSGLR